MDPQVLKKINKARAERKACIVVTDLTEGRDRLVLEGDDVGGELGEAVAKVFRSGKSSTITIGETEFFLNAHLPAVRIIVIGAVHISQALVTIAQAAGYNLHVIDPRTAFATKERFANVKLDAEWPEDVLGEGALDAYTALVAVTHDPKIDDYPLMEAMKAKCFYIGALGSKKTHAKRTVRLKEQGMSDAQLARIHAPIGLSIGAANPPEIAVAIMAQIINVLRNGKDAA